MKKIDGVLKKICNKKQEEFLEKKRKKPLEDLIQELESKSDVDNRDFKKAIESERISLIAEIKKSSPSQIGKPFCNNFDPVKLARVYEDSGASAISVITEKNFFMGDLSFLQKVKEVTKLPILRKDFILDEYHIYESKLAGADAVLLMASILEKEELKLFFQLSKELKLASLIEVHNREELEFVLEIEGIEIIGINNRNLKTLEIDLDNFSHLSSLIPDSIIKVAESGINNNADVLRMSSSGARAILVGTSIIKSNNVSKKIKELIS